MRSTNNQGGIQRGDREETGDLEARPTEKAPEAGRDDLDDLSVHGASDPDLGLTDVGDVPPDDWAANTGPTRSNEESSHGVDTRLVDDDKGVGGRRIDLTPTKDQDRDKR